MRQVSNAFLLNMAEVSATLIGLFLVGVFFYVESGFRRFDRARERFEPYLRSGTRITMIVFAISLGLSLALVALTLPWARALFAVLSLVLVAANVDSALRVRGVKKATGSTALLVNEVLATAMVVCSSSRRGPSEGCIRPGRTSRGRSCSRSPRGSSASARP